jgi:hypothetical protein
MCTEAYHEALTLAFFAAASSASDPTAAPCQCHATDADRETTDHIATRLDSTLPRKKERV